MTALARACPAFAQEPSLQRYEGADRIEKVAAAARKEGWFMLYTRFAEKDLPRLTAAFEKRYGVKVRVWRSASEKVVERAVIETGAGRHEFDAIHTSALEMEALYREKVLQPVAPAHGVQLLAGALRPHRAWTATYLSFWVQAYNTSVVKKEDLPRTYQDLLDPKWKGKLGIEPRVPEGYATVAMDMVEERGSPSSRTLVARNDIPVRGGPGLPSHP